MLHDIDTDEDYRSLLAGSFQAPIMREWSLAMYRLDPVLSARP